MTPSQVVQEGVAAHVEASRCLPDQSNQTTMTKRCGGIRVRSGRIFAIIPAAFVSAWVHPALAQELAGDPAGSGVLVGAVRWLEGTLLGTVATVVAVIAVAFVGFMMLTGRINWRYGATVIIGCFILFGAASIVAGIQSTAALGG